MNMIRWQPFHELVGLRQAVDKLFEDSFVIPSRLSGAFGSGMVTPIDMYHTANDVVVKAVLPWVKPEEVDITITGDNLTIRGETKAEAEVKQEDYLCQEHRFGAFSRSVTLPSGLNTDKAEADFGEGILTLTIPKSEQVKPRSIKVKDKGVGEGKK